MHIRHSSIANMHILDTCSIYCLATTPKCAYLCDEVVQYIARSLTLLTAALCVYHDYDSASFEERLRKINMLVSFHYAAAHDSAIANRTHKNSQRRHKMRTLIVLCALMTATQSLCKSVAAFESKFVVTFPWLLRRVNGSPG